MFSLEPETTSHYLLCCYNFSSARSAVMNNLYLIDRSISQLNETALANTLQYGDSKESISQNSKILQSTIKYVFVTKQFDECFSKGHTCMLDLFYFFTLLISRWPPGWIKCLNIKWLEVGDVICIFVPYYLNCHIRSNKAVFLCCLQFLLPFYFIFC